MTMLLTKIDNEDGGESQSKKRKMRRNDDSLPTSHGSIMNECLWSKLPLELLERVLANLPVDALCRFRSVCKAWKAFISSYGCVELSHKTAHKGPWCLAITPDCEGGAVYDVAMDKWYQLSLPSVAAKHGMKLFSTVGGFLCFKNFENNVFIVYNPLTRSCKKTPKREKYTSMRDKTWVVADQSEGFSVVVLGYSRRCQVYDSYSNSWSKCGLLPVDTTISKESFAPARSVAIDGTLYVISNAPFDLVTFDTITRSWSRLYVQRPSKSWNHILAESRGRICMLAFEKKSGNTCFSEWQLQTRQMSWNKVATMPETVCPELSDGSNGEWQVYGLANRDLVLLRFVNAHGQECSVLYASSQKIWKRISNLPLLPPRHPTDSQISRFSE